MSFVDLCRIFDAGAVGNGPGPNSGRTPAQKRPKTDPKPTNIQSCRALLAQPSPAAIAAFFGFVLRPRSSPSLIAAPDRRADLSTGKRRKTLEMQTQLYIIAVHKMIFGRGLAPLEAQIRFEVEDSRPDP